MQIFTPTIWEIDSTSSFAPISFFLVLQGSELICNAFSRNFSICISYQQCQQLSTIPISLYPIGFFFGYQIPNRCFSDIICHVKNLKMQVAYCNLHGKLDEVHSPHVKMIIMDIITSGVKWWPLFFLYLCRTLELGCYIKDPGD